MSNIEHEVIQMLALKVTGTMKQGIDWSLEFEKS